MARKVKTIPATVNRFTEVPLGSTIKKKVAGYARVSTDHEDQVTSYEAQVKYYTEYIKGRSDWEFAGMYTDEGITATSTAKREGFKRMISDAKAGKIDLIITKSVSRFARNTVDSLTTIRELRDKGIEVYFEKENIWTLDAKGELMITIMSSLAQEEARSISENTTWGVRKRFENGQVQVPFKNFNGFDRGENGELVVNEEEAKTVRLIFRLYLEGLSSYAIAKELMRKGIKTAGGRDQWYAGTIRGILQNEKYTGDALLQKTYCTSFLTKKFKKNNGEVPQYFVEGNHKAIIDHEVFALVQDEMKRRKENGGRYSGVSIFSNKIKCGQCGSWYGSKVWHSNDKYRTIIYQCNHKFDGGEKCKTPHLKEDQIKELFVKAMNLKIKDKAGVLENVRTAIQTLRDLDDLKAEQEGLESEMTILVGQIHDWVEENARRAMDQAAYNKKYNEMVEKYGTLKSRYDSNAATIDQSLTSARTLEEFANTLEKQDVMTEFDERVWGSMVDFMTVYSKDDIRVTFKDGTEVKVND